METKKTAYEIGREVGISGIDCAKKTRRDMLRAAGIEATSESAESFEAGKKDGAQVTYDKGAVEREKTAAAKTRVAKYLEKTDEIIARERASHRGEEMFEFAARKRLENVGIVKAPADFVAATEEFLS